MDIPNYITYLTSQDIANALTVDACRLCIETGLCASKGEFKRLVAQKGIRILPRKDGVIIEKGKLKKVYVTVVPKLIYKIRRFINGLKER